MQDWERAQCIKSRQVEHTSKEVAHLHPSNMHKQDDICPARGSSSSGAGPGCRLGGFDKTPGLVLEGKRRA